MINKNKQKKAFYYACSRYGTERYPSETIKAENAIKIEDKLTSNPECEKCGSKTTIIDQITGVGVYIIELENRGILTNNKKITDYEYYCYDCCKENNLFRKFREQYEELSLLTR